MDPCPERGKVNEVEIMREDKMIHPEITTLSDF